MFDKVTVLYEGRQIFFGRAYEAKAYFEGLGFECPEAQTTPDFLTSMTSASERIIRPGCESLAPRTPDEFAQRWKDSPERRALLDEIQRYIVEHPFDNADLRLFAEARKSEKSSKQRERSPYTLSYWRQIKLCMWREWRRICGDPAVMVFQIVVNMIQSVIIASVFYNLSADTSTFFSRGAVMFMMILMSALASMLEIMALYEKRPMVDKHSRYALYHPSAEAISSMIMDLPSKFIMSISCNLIIYFMANLRRTPEAFFFYLLLAFTAMMSMSMFFRFFASMTKTIAQALAPTAIINLALVLYTGFAIPPSYMRGWASWLRYVNPIAYAFEAVMVNEFDSRSFPCVSFIPMGPGYEDIEPLQRSCSTVGSVPGSPDVKGTEFLEQSFGYVPSHRWRDFGILLAFVFFFLAIHLVSTELIAGERSKGEVLVFRRGKSHTTRVKQQHVDEEQTPSGSTMSETFEKSSEKSVEVEKQTSIFHWKDVCYDIKVNGEERRLLDHVDGWIKPGSLTALMVCILYP